MKINVGKQEQIEAKDSVSLRADKGFELVFKATDCYVDMDLGRVIVRCKRFSVREKKAKKQKEF